MKLFSFTQDAMQAPETQEIARASRLAEMLRQQSAQTPSGRMVGPVYVPESPLAHIASALSSYGAWKMDEKADELRRQAEETKAKKLADAFATYQTAISPRDEQRQVDVQRDVTQGTVGGTLDVMPETIKETVTQRIVPTEQDKKNARLGLIGQTMGPNAVLAEMLKQDEPVKPIMIQAGGRTILANPFTGEPVKEFAHTETPAELRARENLLYQRGRDVLADKRYDQSRFDQQVKDYNARLQDWNKPVEIPQADGSKRVEPQGLVMGWAKPESPLREQPVTGSIARPAIPKGAIDPSTISIPSDDPEIVRTMPALIWQESKGNPSAVSQRGARGLTQVMPDTAKKPGLGVTPMQNNSEVEQVRFGTEYLTALKRHYGGDMTKALAAYNAGIGNMQTALSTAKAKNDPDWIKYLPKPSETIPYVQNIQKHVRDGVFAKPPAQPESPTPANNLAGVVKTDTGYIIPAKPGSEAVKLSEDQGKAAMYFTQARGAYNALEKLFSKPGEPNFVKNNAVSAFLDALPDVGVNRALSERLKSGDRQAFEHAMDLFSSATLRAATGAGLNKDEVRMELERVVPRFNDKQQVVEQKMRMLRDYMAALEMRAGPAVGAIAKTKEKSTAPYLMPEKTPQTPSEQVPTPTNMSTIPSATPVKPPVNALTRWARG